MEPASPSTASQQVVSPTHSPPSRLIAADPRLCVAIATFPLFSPPLARGLLLSPVQTSALASASIAGQYGSAFMWGVLCDRRGPGAVSLAAAALFAGGFGMMGWMASRGTPLLEGQWVWLSAFYFLAGCGTSASYFSAIIAATKSFPARHSGLGEFHSM